MPVRWQGDKLFISLTQGGPEGCGAIAAGKPVVHACSATADGALFVAACTADTVAFFIAHTVGEALQVKRAGVWCLPEAPQQPRATHHLLRLSLSHDARYTLAVTEANAYILSRGSGAYEGDGTPASQSSDFVSFCPTEAPQPSRAAAASGAARASPSQLLDARWWSPHLHGSAAGFALAGLGAHLGSISGNTAAVRSYSEGAAVGASNYPAILLVFDASGRCEVWRETDPWCAPTFTRCLSIQVAEPVSGPPPPPPALPEGLVRRSTPALCGCSSTASPSPTTASSPSSGSTAAEAACTTAVHCTHASACWVQRRVVHDRLHWMHGQESQQQQQSLTYLPSASNEQGSGSSGASVSDSSAPAGEGILALPPLPHAGSVTALAASLAAAAAAGGAGGSSKTDNTGMSAPLPKSFMQHTAVSVQELSSHVSLSSGSSGRGEAEASAAAPPATPARAPEALAWPSTGHWRETEIASRPRAGSLLRSASSASFRVVEMQPEAPLDAPCPAPAPAPAASPAEDLVPTALLLSDSPSGAQSMHTEYFVVSECLTRVRSCVHAYERVPGVDDKSCPAPAAIEVGRESSIRLTLWRVAGVRDVPQRHFSVTKCKVVEVPLAGLGALAVVAATPSAATCRVTGAVSDVLYRSGGQAVPTLLKLGDGKGARSAGSGAGGRGRRQQQSDASSSDAVCAWLAAVPDATSAVTCCGGGVDALDAFRSIAGQEAVWAAVASSSEEADPALAALHSGAGQLHHPSSPALAPMTPMPEGGSAVEGGAAVSSSRASLGSPLGARAGGLSTAAASAGAGAASTASKLRSRAASALATAVTLDVSAGDWGDPHRLLPDGCDGAAHRVRWWFDGRAQAQALLQPASTESAGAAAAGTEAAEAPSTATDAAAEDGAGAAASSAAAPADAPLPRSCGPTSSTDNSWDVFHRVPSRTGARGACVPLRASEAPQGARLLLETGAGTGVDVIIDWEAGAVQALGTVKLQVQGNGAASSALAPFPNGVSAWEPTSLPTMAVALEAPLASTQPAAAPHPCQPEGKATAASTGSVSALPSEALPQHHPSFLLSCLRNGTPAVVATVLAHLGHSLLRAVAWRKVLRAAITREDGRATERRKAKLAALIKSDRGSSHALPSLMTDSDTCSLRAQWDDTAVLREEGWWIGDDDESGAGAQAGEAALMKVAVAPLPASYLLAVAGAGSSASTSKPSAPSSSSSFVSSLFSSEAPASSSTTAIMPEEDEAADNAAAEDATDVPDWLLSCGAEEDMSAACGGPYPLRVLRRWYGCPGLHDAVHPSPTALVSLADRWTSDAAASTDAGSYRPRLSGPLLAALAAHLPNASIAGLGPGDNLLLLAVIETMRALYGSQRSEAAALDPAGFQFLLSVKLFQVSRRCLSPADRPAGLAWSDCAWALQSDSQDALFRLCVPASLSWADMLALRIPLWLRSEDHLAEAVTRVATTQFQRSEHDPFSCMLTYLTLGPSKLAVVRNLFRLSPPHQKVYGFLMNDFTQERWKRAASKNAFALLSQHRHEPAAAFFLLAGRLPQAIKVALMEMKDPALGLTMARLGARPGSGWLTPGAVTLPPGAPAMGPSAKYTGVDSTALLREAAQALLDIKKGAAAAKPAGMGSGGSGSGFGAPAAPVRPTSILGFGFDDDYDSMPVVKPAAPKAPSLLGDYDEDDEDDDPTVYRPKGTKAGGAGKAKTGNDGDDGDAGPPAPATIFVDTRPGPTGATRYCIDTHPVEHVLQMEYLALATGECTPTPSGASGKEAEAAALRYLICCTLQKPLDATRAFVGSVLKAALPPPPAAGQAHHHHAPPTAAATHFRPSDACPPPPVLRLLKHALSQPQMKNPVVVKVLLAEVLAGAAAARAAAAAHLPASASAATSPTPGELAAAMAQLDDPSVTALLTPCLDALVSSALASCLIRSGSGLAACSTVAAAQQAFLDKAGRALTALEQAGSTAPSDTGPVKLLPFTAHVLATVREAAGVAVLQATAASLQVCIEDFLALQAACRSVSGWWRLPHAAHSGGAAGRRTATAPPATPAAPALQLPASMEPFARALLADVDAVLPNPSTSMTAAFTALTTSSARSHRWATGLLTALLAGGRARPQPAPAEGAGAAAGEGAATEGAAPAPHHETGFTETWPLHLPLAGCRAAVLSLARGLLVASQEALAGYFKLNPLLPVHAGAQKLVVAAVTQPECVPCVGPAAMAAIATINSKAAETAEAVLATHARLGAAMAALIPLLIEARVHTGVLPPHGWDRFILSAWLHLLVVALVSRDAGLLLRLLTRWMPDRVEGLPHGESVFQPRCVAFKDTCPAFALAPGLAAACAAAKIAPGVGERRAGYDAAGWRAPGVAEGCGASQGGGSPVPAVVSRVPAWELWLDDFLSLAFTCLASTAALQSLLDRDNHPLTLQGWPVYAALNGWRQASVLRMLLGKVELSGPSAALLQPAAFLAGSPVTFPVATACSQLDAAAAAAHPRRHILAALLGLPLVSPNPLPGLPPAAASASSSMWWRDVDALLGCSNPSSGIVTPPLSGSDAGASAGAMTTPLAHLWSWLGGPGLLWTLGTERRALSRAVARVLTRGGIPDVRRTLRLELLLPLQQASSSAAPAAGGAPGAKKAPVPPAGPGRGPLPSLPSPASGVLPATIYTMTAIPLPPATATAEVPGLRALGATTTLQHGELLRLLGPLLLVSAAPFGVRHLQLRARRATAASGATASAAGGAAGAGPASAKAPKRKIMKLFDAIADSVHGAGHGAGEAGGPAASPPRKETAGFPAPRVASIRLSTRDIEGFMMVESEAVPVPIALHAGSSGGGGGSAPAPAPAPASATRQAPSAPAGPRTYELLPEPVFMFQKPFTLPATALDHHPVLPLYVRAGPGPVLAIITLTLQEAGGATAAARRAPGAAATLTADQVTPIIAQHSLHSVLSWTPLPPDPPLGATLPPALAAAAGLADRGGTRATPRSAAANRSGGGSSNSGGLLAGFLHGGSHRERDGGAAAPNGSIPTVGASEATGLGATLLDPGVDLDEQILKTRWSPDGRSLLACFASGVVRVWDAAVPDLPAAVLTCSPRRSLAPSVLPPQAPPNTCIDFPVFAVTDAVTLTTEARVIAVGTAPVFHASSPFANATGAAAGAASAAAAAAISDATAKVPAAAAPRPGAGAAAPAAPPLHRALPSGAHLLSVFDARVSEEVPVWQDFNASTSKIAAAIGGITALFYDDASLHLVIGTALGAVLLYDVRRRFVRGVFYWSGEGTTVGAATWVTTEGLGGEADREEAALEALLTAQSRCASAEGAALPPWRAVTSLVDHPSHAAVVVGWQDGGVGVLPLTMPSAAVGASALTAGGDTAASLIAGMHASAWGGGAAAPLASPTAASPAAGLQQGAVTPAAASHGQVRAGAPRSVAPLHLCGSPWSARGGTVATAATEEFLISAGQDGGLYGLYQIY